MKIEFTLKDRNGIELNEGDPVNWYCPNIPEEDCGGWRMWNSGEIIPGKLVFFKTVEQVSSEYHKTQAYKESKYKRYSPSDVAGLQLMFVSEKGDPIWSIGCPSEGNDFRHLSLEKRKLQTTKHNCQLCNNFMEQIPVEQLPKSNEPTKIIDLGHVPSGHSFIGEPSNIIESMFDKPKEVTLIPYRCPKCGHMKSYRS